MIKLEKFDGRKTYMFPNGAVATPEVIRNKYPAVDYFTHVFEVNGNILQAVMELSAFRNIHGINETLTEAEAIEELQVIINTTQEVDNTPTTEERIAAAMEFQNLLNM